MTDQTVWIVIIGLGIGTFIIRYSFIGIIGDKELPEWLVRHLRYVPVAVLPGLVAPLVVWPAATNGDADPARLTAATVALFIGAVFKSTLGAVFGGMSALYLVQNIFY
ncbi:MAG: AzlD domain-containing protein [Gammaproteobacteria bacterium]|jgi:branched-subunit amino acid transport protein|nr:AzlD domain-containing protein [Gammaproteobacteria bacterium]MBT3725377.1 AzlD domain-containing protein [Gammaproteobacteria bacterium]MBT4193691.1 AzlD domain-containing protein [Gammaproteobacteria bacterium]MBT4451013.1 AzlD domain-containing protein [Gammaproteobacteria bacterium]MBT4859519.1 AzlD domain-containing protein [Gammaproteobacteria bacterium]